VLIATLRSGLLEMCENSTEGPSELTEVLIRCYIDSAYIASQLDSRNITSSWANSLVHRANRFGGQAIVDEALKTCVSEGVIPQYQSYISRLERQQQSQSGVKQFYHEIAGGKKSYSEWLTEFEEAVADIRKETAED